MASLMRVRSQGLPMAAARQTSSRVSAGDSVSTRPSRGQRRGVEGLFQQGGKEHAGFGLLADLFGIGAQQQHRLAGHAWVQADLAGEVQTAAIGQPGVDDEEVVDIGLSLQQGAGLGQAGGPISIP